VKIMLLYPPYGHINSFFVAVLTTRIDEWKNTILMGQNGVTVGAGRGKAIILGT
jgi:hypothetical protein